MSDYDRITVERVRQAQSKTGLPFCRGVYRKHDHDTDATIAACPLEQVLIAESEMPCLSPLYIASFTMAVDNPDKPNLYPTDPVRTQGYEDGLAVRKEFFDD